MREIKFKGWNGMKMLEPQDLSQNGLNWRWLGKEDVTLLQFTGLLDDEGKEIYEGDVITCYAIQRETNEVIEDGTKVEVKYQNGYFYPFGFNAGWRSNVGNIKIIGNIYENPELLTNPSNK